MLEGIFKFGYEDLSDAFDIRKKVFQIEQNISPDIEFDELDKEAIHVVAYDNNIPVATGRLVFDGSYYKLGRIAVLKEYRGKNYGDFIVRMLVDKAFSMGASEINIGSQVKVQEFYKKIGFVQSGEEYVEAGIPHVPMKLYKNTMCSGCCSN